MANKTLVIGLGSTGASIVHDVMERIENEYGSLDRVPWVRMVAYETEPITEHKLNRGDKALIRRVTLNDKEEGQVRKDQALELQQGMGLDEWWDPDIALRLKKEMPGAGNNRMIGKFMFTLQRNIKNFADELQKSLDSLTKIDAAGSLKAMGTLPDGSVPQIDLSNQIFVYLCGAFTGGTASGFMIDAGFFVKNYVAAKGYSAKVIGLVGIPSPSYRSTDRKASAFAALKELNHYHHNGSRYDQKFHHAEVDRVRTSPGERPFDEVFLGMPRIGEHGEHPEELLNDSFAEFIYVGAMSRAGDAVAGQLINPSTQHAPQAAWDGSPQDFSTFGVSVIEYPSAHLMKGCSTRLALEALRAWTHSDLTEDQAGPLVARDLELTDAELARRLTRPDEKINLDVIQQMLKKFVSDARASKDPIAVLERSTSEIQRLFDPRSADGSPVLELIQRNSAAEGPALLDTMTARIKAHLKEIDEGPEYVAVLLAAAQKACVDLAVEAEGWNQLRNAGWAGMKDALDRLKDAQRSKIATGLIWRITSFQYWIKRFLVSAQGYWNASVHVACLPHKLEMLKSIHNLAETDQEGLFDVIERRISDTQWGLRQWGQDMQHQLADSYNEIENNPPKVNGTVLYEPGKTLNEEYAKLIAKAPTSVPNQVVRQRHGAAQDFAQSVVIDAWDWMTDQLLGKSSVFDPQTSTNIQTTRKYVLQPEKAELLEQSRPFFRELFQRNVLDLLIKNKSDEDINTAVDRASLAAAPFLDINDSRSKLGAPHDADPRTPAFAFFKGAKSVDPLVEKLKGALNRDNAPVDPIRNFEEMDLPYRIVLVRGRAVFPIRSITGIDDLEKWYGEHNDLLGIHTNTRARYKDLKADQMDLDPTIGEFLAALAINRVAGGVPGAFTVQVRASGPQERDRVLQLGHDLEDVAQELLGPANRGAKNQLQKGIEDEIRTRGEGDFCEALDKLADSIESYKLLYKGRIVDKEQCTSLLFDFLKNAPKIRAHWIRIRYGDQQIDLESYFRKAGQSVEERRIYPIAGYYCDRCYQLLANGNPQEQIPVQCPRCRKILRVDKFE